MTTDARAGRGQATRAWAAVAQQEARDVWWGGRGPVLIFVFSIVLSAVTYLAASNQALNFLEQHEAVNLTLQVAIAVGTLLALLAGADAISGERERGTLESLLLTPARRGDLFAGKLLAALSLWLAAFVVTVPYVWFLSRGTGALGDAIAVGLFAGTLLAIGLAALGLVVSAFAASNRTSLAVSLFILLALFAPTQLPTTARHGWAGDFLWRVNPVTAAEHYVGTVVVDGQSWTQEASWLASPLVAAIGLTAIAIFVVPRSLTRRGGWLG
jgi:ABC-2 type transport system permease protein